MTFLNDQSERSADCIAALASDSDDPFGTVAAVATLAEVLRSSDLEATLAAHTDLLHRLDVALTRARKIRGDEADILQTVRWQRELFSSPAMADNPATQRVHLASQALITGYEAGTLGNVDYPDLVVSLADDLREASHRLPDLLPHVEAMQRCAGSIPDLQGAHREYLKRLSRSALGQEDFPRRLHRAGAGRGTRISAGLSLKSRVAVGLRDVQIAAHSFARHSPGRR